MVSFYAVAFENVGINCALCEEGDAFKLACFFIEYLDEFAADDLTLLFGFCNVLEEIEEAICCIYVNEVSIELVLEDFDNLFAFAFTHKTVVYVYANELLTDCFDEKRSNNRRVNAAGKSEQYLFVANLFANSCNLLSDELICKFRGCDTSHRIRSDIGIHIIFLL